MVGPGAVWENPVVATDAPFDLAVRCLRLGLAAQWSVMALFIPRASLPLLGGILVGIALVLWGVERASRVPGSTAEPDELLQASAVASEGRSLDHIVLTAQARVSAPFPRAVPIRSQGTGGTGAQRRVAWLRHAGPRPSVSVRPAGASGGRTPGLAGGPGRGG